MPRRRFGRKNPQTAAGTAPPPPSSSSPTTTAGLSRAAPAPPAPAASRSGSVLVAVDGGSAGWEALDWAAAEATARGSRLRIIHVVDAPSSSELLLSVVWTPGPVWQPQNVEAGQRVLEAGLARVRLLFPELTVSLDLQLGPPGTVVGRESRSDSLVVIGRSRRSGAHGRMTSQVVERARCPVAVVCLSTGNPSGPTSGRSLLVVDEGTSPAAIGVAFRDADRRGVGLTVLSPACFADRTDPQRAGREDLPTTVRPRPIELVLAGCQHAFAEVNVRHLCGLDEHPLENVSEGAAITVVGLRRRRRFGKGVIPSVTVAAIDAAQGTVLIVKNFPSPRTPY